MRARLSRHLDGLNLLVSDLKGSSEQVAAVSNDLYVASHEQLDALNTTVSASHEIRSQIERTSDNVSNLSEDAGRLEKMVQAGHQVLQEMVSSSQEIKSGAGKFETEMRESISQLSNAMNAIQEIAQKTKIINEIVFQTKLLSFNASVEAARAGEAGKGFSVVAEEVGKLAQMSGAAANEISGIVEQSITVVQAAIQTTKSKIEVLTRETAAKSEVGYSNSKQCEKLFEDMASRITETTRVIGEISIAMKEQSIGVGQLDRSIHELQEVANRNRLVASQTTEHAKEFEHQTASLSDTVKAISRIQNQAAKKQLQKFVWSEKLMLGIREMDDEHKILVGKINTLVTYLEQKDLSADNDAIFAAFSDLAQYTAEHFADEERFMQSIGYAEFASHKKIHQKLLAQVGKFGESIKSRTLDDQKLVAFLRNWLISHIMGVDMQYAAHHKGKKTA